MAELAALAAGRFPFLLPISLTKLENLDGRCRATEQVQRGAQYVDSGNDR